MSAPANGDLRRAMAAVAADRNDETMRALFRALIDSHLLIPVRRADQRGVELAVVEEPDGTTFHAFSSERTLLSALPDGVPYLVLAMPALARMVLDDPSATLVVDPAAPEGGRLNRRDLELLRDRLVPGEGGSAVAAPGGELRVFALSEEPPEPLLRALREAAEREPCVEALHLFEGQLGLGERHLFVGVHLAEGTPGESRAPTLATLSEALRGQLSPNAFVDVVALDDEVLDPVRRAARTIWAGDRAGAEREDGADGTPA